MTETTLSFEQIIEQARVEAEASLIEQQRALDALELAMPEAMAKANQAWVNSTSLKERMEAAVDLQAVAQIDYEIAHFRFCPDPRMITIMNRNLPLLEAQPELHSLVSRVVDLTEPIFAYHDSRHQARLWWEAAITLDGGDQDVPLAAAADEWTRTMDAIIALMQLKSRLRLHSKSDFSHHPDLPKRVDINPTGKKKVRGWKNVAYSPEQGAKTLALHFCQARIAARFRRLTNAEQYPSLPEGHSRFTAESVPTR